MTIHKPQKPLMVNNEPLYPMTSADQILMENGERLNAAIEKYLIPSYTATDFGKILGCSASGLQWINSQSELENAETTTF